MAKKNNVETKKTTSYKSPTKTVVGKIIISILIVSMVAGIIAVIAFMIYFLLTNV